jgi:toxin ParE1/3/4
MPVRVQLAPAAERDLEEIAEYIEAQAGPRIALNVVRRLRAKTALLRENPYIGAEDERIGIRRKLIQRPYIIAYRIVSATEVNVLRIVHGARDLPGLFADDTN